MNESPLVYALKLLAFDVPVLVLYGVGMVAALVYWARFPRPSLLTLLGCGLLLTTSIASTLTGVYVAHARFEQSPNDARSDWLLPTMGMMGSLLRGVAVALLVLAVFSTRFKCQATVSTHVQRLIRFGLAWTSLVVYSISLCMPAVYISGHGEYRGVECLIQLPLALMCPAWWANPVFAVGIALVLMGYLVPGGICGLMSLLFSLSYCLNNEPVRIGYWLWVGAMMVLAASIILSVAGRQDTKLQSPTSHETVANSN